MPTNSQSLIPNRPAPQSRRARQLAAGLLDLFDPNVRRLGLLPYPQGSLSGQKGPVEWSNWVAPQLAVDMVKAIELPGRAWRGEQINPDDVTKMAMDTMGGSGLLSRAVPTGNVGGLLGINVFHGGPHRWASEPGFPQGRPRMDKMGTGEGAQAYGHGFYGAEAKGVGKSYQAETAFKYGQRDMAEMLYSQKLGDTDAAIKSLSREMVEYDKRGWPSPDYRKQYDEALQKLEGFKTNPPEGGTLYKLDIPDADAAKYLDWDAPLSEQPEAIKGIIDKLNREVIDPGFETSMGDLLADLAKRQGRREPTGKDFYEALSRYQKQSTEATSRQLAEEGIPGLKYRDQMSRYDPDILPDNMIANEARKWLGQSDGDSEKAMKLFKDSNPRELYVDREINEIEKVISTVGRKITRNYVTWDQDVLDRIKILERDGKPNAY